MIRSIYPLVYSNGMHSEYRGNLKDGGNTKTLFTPLDRVMNRTLQIEITDTPANLINGFEWDNLSIQVWERFILCQQKERTYIKKIITWKNLYDTLMVCEYFIRSFSLT